MKRKLKKSQLQMHEKATISAVITNDPLLSMFIDKILVQHFFHHGKALFEEELL